MSSSTWTPAALSSDVRAFAGICWRIVEAHHHVSTLKLVDSVAEQELSRSSSRPQSAAAARVPRSAFRYGAVYPAGRREAIRYASVRDPGHGMNVALLTCRAFANSKPINQGTWHIRLSDAGAQAICEAPKSGITFDRSAFAADFRIAKLRWARTAH